MIRAYGWAVVRDGKIDVRTVHDTERGAMVNWLCVNGVIVTANATDEQITRMWYQATDKLRVQTTVQTRMVAITLCDEDSK